MPYADPIQQKAAQRRWYLRNKDKSNENNRKDRAAKREYLANLKDVPCADCNIKFPWYVMDFDHTNGKTDKVMGIAKLVTTRGWKWLKDELKKCEVVCANCHRIRTHTRKQYNTPL